MAGRTPMIGDDARPRSARHGPPGEARRDAGAPATRPLPRLPARLRLALPGVAGHVPRRHLPGPGVLLALVHPEVNHCESSRHTPCAVAGSTRVAATAHGVCLLLCRAMPASAARPRG